MPRFTLHGALLAALLVSSPVAIASDASTTASDTAEVTDGFDTGMSGRWVGGGDVLPRIDGNSPLKVKCEIDVTATEANFDLGGECGVLFVKRALTVELERTDEGIEGTYDANLRTGLAKLEGDYGSDEIALDIIWGGEVNGDLEASMTIERSDTDSLHLRVVDQDPASGKDVVTSDLTLTREG